MNIETSVHSSSNYNEYFFKLSDAPKESFWLFFSIWKLGPYDGRRGGGKEAGREGAQEEGNGVLLLRIHVRPLLPVDISRALRATDGDDDLTFIVFFQQYDLFSGKVDVNMDRTQDWVSSQTP